ncbi:MAG: formylglycine-generating enzyme family protein [Pseudomonas sp.]
MSFIKCGGLIATTWFLFACDSASRVEHERRASRVIEAALKNMIAVEGGEFLMGDFGPLMGENLPYTFNQDDKKLHRVILDDFMISKYKVTYDDYEAYRAINGGRRLIVGLSKNAPKIIEGGVSASVTWQQAKDYCLWLGKELGKNVDLPTEAQWEYAARSRGLYLPFATDDGTFDEGRNIPSGKQKEKMIGTSFPYYPIGLYPPNPLGLYDMGLSGSEWANDWYADDYYWYSPESNPQGPEIGTAKVRRGYTGGDPQLALTMFRRKALPVPVTEGLNYEKHGIIPSFVFRCVVNGDKDLPEG